MNEREKSDSVIVAMKPGNNAEPFVAEPAERRTGTKGNAGQQSTRRAQDRESVSQALSRIRKVAKGKERGEVHDALPPPRCTDATHGLLRTQEGRRAWRRWRHVGGLRSRSRLKDRRPAFAALSRGVSGAARSATVCEVAWNKDPALGLICIQSGPRS